MKQDEGGQTAQHEGQTKQEGMAQTSLDTKGEQEISGDPKKTSLAIAAGEGPIDVIRMLKVDNQDRRAATERVEAGQTIEMEIEGWLRIEIVEYEKPAFEGAQLVPKAVRP